MLKPALTLGLLIFLTTGTAFADSLTLAEALSKRAVTSESLKISKINVLNAQEGVISSRSGYLPRVDIQGGYTAQQAPQSVVVPALGSFKTQEPDYGFASLGIVQTLYDFGRTDARYAHAKASREAADFGSKGLEQDLFLRTVTTYFGILQGEKRLKAAEDEVTQMTEHLRVAQTFFDQGVVTRNNLLQAEVQLASSKQRRLEIANRLNNTWLDLNNQIGEQPEFRRDLVDETIFETNLDKPVSEAIDKHSEIQAQRKLLEGTESDVKLSRSDYYPEFFARLGLDYVQNDTVKEQTTMSATVGLKINLFDGFVTTSRLHQAVNNRLQATERLTQLQKDLALEYRTAVNDARVAKQRILVTETSLKQGEENLRINKDRFLEQVGTGTDVIDAQTLLTQIRTEQYQANFDYEVALARVKRACGALSANGEK